MIDHRLTIVVLLLTNYKSIECDQHNDPISFDRLASVYRSLVQPAEILSHFSDAHPDYIFNPTATLLVYTNSTHTVVDVIGHLLDIDHLRVPDMQQPSLIILTHIDSLFPLAQIQSTLDPTIAFAPPQLHATGLINTTVIIASLVNETAVDWLITANLIDMIVVIGGVDTIDDYIIERTRKHHHLPTLFLTGNDHHQPSEIIRNRMRTLNRQLIDRKQAHFIAHSNAVSAHVHLVDTIIDHYRRSLPHSFDDIIQIYNESIENYRLFFNQYPIDSLQTSDEYCHQADKHCAYTTLKKMTIDDDWECDRNESNIISTDGYNSWIMPSFGIFAEAAKQPDQQASSPTAAAADHHRHHRTGQPSTTRVGRHKRRVPKTWRQARKLAIARKSAKYQQEQETIEIGSLSYRQMQLKCLYRKSCYTTGKVPPTTILSDPQSDESDDDEDDEELEVREIKLLCKYRKSCYTDNGLDVSGDEKQSNRQLFAKKSAIPVAAERKATLKMIAKYVSAKVEIDTKEHRKRARTSKPPIATPIRLKEEAQRGKLESCKYRKSCYGTGAPPIIDKSHFIANLRAIIDDFQLIRSANETTTDNTENRMDNGKLACKYRRSCYETGQLPVIMSPQSETIIPVVPLEIFEKVIPIEMRCKYRKSCYDSGVLPDALRAKDPEQEEAERRQKLEDGDGSRTVMPITVDHLRIYCKYRKSCYMRTAAEEKEGGVGVLNEKHPVVANNDSIEISSNDDDDEKPIAKNENKHHRRNKNTIKKHLQSEDEEAPPPSPPPPDIDQNLGQETIIDVEHEKPSPKRLAKKVEIHKDDDDEEEKQDDDNDDEEEERDDDESEERHEHRQHRQRSLRLKKKKIEDEQSPVESNIEIPTEFVQQRDGYGSNDEEPIEVVAIENKDEEMNEERQVESQIEIPTEKVDIDDDLEVDERQIKVQCQYRKSCYEEHGLGVKKMIEIDRKSKKRPLLAKKKHVPVAHRVTTLKTIAQYVVDRVEAADNEEEKKRRKPKTTRVDNVLVESETRARAKLDCKYRKSCYSTGKLPEIWIKPDEPLIIISDDDDESDQVQQKLACKYRKSCYETGKLTIETPPKKPTPAPYNDKEIVADSISKITDATSIPATVADLKLVCRYRKSCYQYAAQAEIKRESSEKKARKSKSAIKSKNSPKETTKSKAAPPPSPPPITDAEVDKIDIDDLNLKLKCHYRRSCYDSGRVPANLHTTPTKCNRFLISCQTRMGMPIKERAPIGPNGKKLCRKKTANETNTTTADR